MGDTDRGRENAEALFTEAAEAVNALYHVRDTYFPANTVDKTSKLLEESNLVIQLLEKIPPEKRRAPLQRATYEYLRGKVLDVLPEYKKEAEDHLSKAVKLDPSLAGAWLSLSNCIWKKGDLASAKNCLTLGLRKGPDKGILCQLSMLERKMAKGTEDQAKMVDDSIKHAKKAIALDVQDGNSWYILGNAYLTSFFASGSWDSARLLQSLKAYQHAEKDVRMTSNPDLYFNSATVNNYLENYERALSGFEAASLRDPGLNAMKEVDKIVQLLEKIESLLQMCLTGNKKIHIVMDSLFGEDALIFFSKLRGQTKSKRLASLASSLACVNLNLSYKRDTIDHLVNGVNKAVAIVGKVIFFIKHGVGAPFYYVLCDSSQIRYVMSVYGIQSEAIKEGDQVTILDPCYKLVDFSWKGKLHQFRSVRVDFLKQMLVNGKPLSPQHSVRTAIFTQNKT